MTRIKIINQIIKDRGYTSYLEIGIGDGSNFNGIECEVKRGCDPEWKESEVIMSATSDNFFMTLNEFNPDFKFDLIFIDGLHHSPQVEKDIINSWKCLNKGGMILIHDVRPKNIEEQVVPMGNYPTWTGDVWRAWYGFKKCHPKIKAYYIEEENGLGSIEKSRHKVDFGFVDYKTSWEEYNESRGWEI